MTASDNWNLEVSNPQRAVLLMLVSVFGGSHDLYAPRITRRKTQALISIKLMKTDMMEISIECWRKNLLNIHSFK